MPDRASETPAAQALPETQAQEVFQTQAVASVVARGQDIRYASDAEVDRAMEGIFRQHDRLFAELAK